MQGSTAVAVAAAESTFGTIAHFDRITPVLEISEPSTPSKLPANSTPLLPMPATVIAACVAQKHSERTAREPSARGRALWATAARPLAAATRGHRRLQAPASPVYAWALFKALGLQKPGWLPDFGVAKRKAVLERFFGGGIDHDKYAALLEGSFKMCEASDGRSGSSAFLFKADFIDQMSAVGRSIPDFSWGADTDGRVDRGEP